MKWNNWDFLEVRIEYVLKINFPNIEGQKISFFKSNLSIISTSLKLF